MSKPKQPRRMARPVLEAGSADAKPSLTCDATHLPAMQKRPSKRDLVLNLMRHEGGASLATIVEATGWLPHTARAALTGLRKNGHTIEKFKVDGETRYSVSTVAAQ